MKRNILALALGVLFSISFFLSVKSMLFRLNIAPIGRLRYLERFEDLTKLNDNEVFILNSLLKQVTEFEYYNLIPLTILLTGILVGIVAKSKGYLISIIAVVPLIITLILNRGMIGLFIMGYVVWLSFYLGLAGVSAYGVDFLIEKIRIKRL